MTRVKRGYVARKRRRKILRVNRSYRGAHSTLFRVANQQYMKALRYAYRDRARKKRDFRRLWIVRINAAVRGYGISYSQFIHSLRVAQVGLNRKVLAQLATFDAPAFATIARMVKS